MTEYIDKQKLIGTLCECCAANPFCKHKNKGGCYDTRLVDEQPTVDVRENIKGKWLINSPHVRCSVCGYLDGVDEIQIYVDKKLIMPNFCPNCGADMRGNTNG